MTIHFDPRAVELQRQAAKAEAFQSAAVRIPFGRRNLPRNTMSREEFVIVLMGVVGLIILIGVAL